MCPVMVLLISSGKGDFINGSRLVYPMEDKAMRFLNHLGNKFFSIVFSWLLEQNIKDTLCGTKVMFRGDYIKLKNLPERDAVVYMNLLHNIIYENE